MKTEKELIMDVISDPNIPVTAKEEEFKKFQICKRCPDTNKCWSCGCWEWWKEGKK